MSDLTVTGVAASYGKTAVLHGLDLHVPTGSLTAILGPSGSGKTTLLRVIAGFERALTGSVRLDDQLVEGPGVHVPAERRGLGYVAQDGALFPHLSVARNVAFALKRSPSRSARVEELLDLVGLVDYGSRYPHELSGGQQQRVALARALASRPAVVLLDEPFAALDASLRADVRRDISRILRETGTTTVLVTHDQDEALSMADQVAVLRNGVMVQTGTPSDLYVHPCDPELARFLGAANVLPGTAGPQGILTALGSSASAVSLTGPVQVLIRPEQLLLSEAGVPATITAFEYHGHEMVLSVLAQGDAGPLPLLVRTPARPLSIGASVALTVAGPVHAWPA